MAKSGAQLYFDESMLVVAGAGIAAEDRNSLGPHDHPDRNQINAGQQLLHKGRDNIAGKYHVDHKIRDAPLPFAADDPLFAGHEPDPDQREYDKLKPQHSDHA